MIWALKTRFLAVADDGNLCHHTWNRLKICSIMENSDAHCFINKVYTDAYTAEIGSTGRTYPSAKKKLLQILDDWAFFVIDYIGHGNCRGMGT